MFGECAGCRFEYYTRQVVRKGVRYKNLLQKKTCWCLTIKTKFEASASHKLTLLTISLSSCLLLLQHQQLKVSQICCCCRWHLVQWLQVDCTDHEALTLGLDQSIDHQ